MKQIFVVNLEFKDKDKTISFDDMGICEQFTRAMRTNPIYKDHIKIGIRYIDMVEVKNEDADMMEFFMALSDELNS